MFLSASVWADDPVPATTETEQDIPKVASPGRSQENFGRFVKMSKAEFEQDAVLKAKFKNYGQYVSSLRRKDGEHRKRNARKDTEGGSRGGSDGQGGGSTAPGSSE